MHAVREREGNTQRRPIPKSVRLPPAAPAEPDWTQPFPLPPLAGKDAKRLRAEARRCREIARKTWRALVPILDAQGVLAEVDGAALKDHAVLVARIDQAERDITLHGVWTVGERGAVKNPAITYLNQCRSNDRPYQQEFGLTPGARDRLNPRDGGDDGDGLFDD